MRGGMESHWPCSLPCRAARCSSMDQLPPGPALEQVRHFPLRRSPVSSGRRTGWEPLIAGIGIGAAKQAQCTTGVRRLGQRGPASSREATAALAATNPTVLDDVLLSADIVGKERFGPVLALLPVRDLDDALEIANRSRYGLHSAVFTTNLERAWRAARALDCRQVRVNDAPAHGVSHFPFGGRKPDSDRIERSGADAMAIRLPPEVSPLTEPHECGIRSARRPQSDIPNRRCRDGGRP